MPLVAGIDSSTQSCKVVVCDASSGEIVRDGRAPHPDGTEVDPARWWHALEEASEGLFDGVAAVSVAGQQHGMVALDGSGDVVRPALLWNDTRSSAAASELVAELGAAAWADAVGTVPVASLTVTKLRWLAEHEPDRAERVATVLLPHDWLTWRLTGGGATPTTDRGDASGTGYWSPSTGGYRLDLLERAFGRRIEVPKVAAPSAIVGETATGVAVAAGTGDNMAAALGVCAGPGDVVVSLGTSGTVFAVSQVPTHDPTGFVAGFADATGHYLPLVCTLNAARVLTAAAAMLGTDLAGLDALTLTAEPGSGGLTLLPYLDGERTPNLPDASGSLLGMTRDNMTPANVARAAVEGMLSCLADGLEALRSQAVDVRRILLVGGAAASQAVQLVASTLFDAPAEVPRPGEYVALGAARQAAWALTGELPDWAGRTNRPLPFNGGGTAADVRRAYATWRTRLHGV